VYLQNDGKVVFGSYPGSTQVATSTAAYNDGQWHHVVATQSSAGGMKLYVDGRLVGENAATTPQNYNGYWRVGGDNLNSWPGIPASQYVTAKIDEVAVYPVALSEGKAKLHYAVATGTPIAQFSASRNGMVASVDAGASSDTDGSIAAYSWNFGDGTAAKSGATTSHTYSTPGAYTVTLTVTDNAGKQSVTTTRITAQDITAPSTPANPTVMDNTGGMVRITWAGSTDDVGVTGYDVYRDGVKIARSTDNIHTDNTVVTDTTYTYTVRAVDAAGNVSAPSGSLTVKSLPVNTAVWYSAANLFSGKCITGSGTADSSPLQQYSCASPAGSNQTFRFVPLDGGYFRVESRAATALVWDVSGASTADNAQIFLYTNHGGTNQQWTVTKNAVDGSYSFAGRGSGKCLQFAGGSDLDGTQLQQATCAATNFQRFQLVVAP
jgi:chitodextrinase